MSGELNVLNVVTVVPVADYDLAVSWYSTLLGRQPDLEPADGVAEWQVAQNAWIQVSFDPTSAGQTTVVLGVADIDAQCANWTAAEVPWGEIQDHSFIKTAEGHDPSGNTVTFVQEVPQADGDQPE